MVAFYPDNGHELPKDLLKHAKAGNTMSIMYAEQHFFVDGQQGIRLEDDDVDRVKVSWSSSCICRRIIDHFAVHYRHILVVWIRSLDLGIVLTV